MENREFCLTGIIPGTGSKTKKYNHTTNEEEINYNNKIKLLENELIKLHKIIKEKEETIEQLKLDVNHQKEKIIKKDQKIIVLETEIKTKNIELKRLNIDLQVKIDENRNNRRINVKFQSSDSIINTTISSFENDKFVVLEEKLYVEFEQYRDTNNIFLMNGNQILKFRSLKENNIKDGQVIILSVFD